MPKTILLVEDRPDFNQLLVSTIKQADPEANVISLLRGDEVMDAIAKEVPDVLLLDLFIPGVGGKEILNQIRSNPELDNLPVVVISNLKLPSEEQQKLLAIPKVQYYPKLDVTPQDIAKAAIDMAAESSQTVGNE